VRQLAAVHRRTLAELAQRTPLLPGADTLAFLDVDSIQRRAYGATKQDAAFGHAKIASKSPLVRGLERAGRHRIHTTGRASRRRGPVAGRQRRIRPRRGQSRGRSHHHHTPGRNDGHAGGARRPPPTTPGRSSPPAAATSPLLGDRANRSESQTHHRHHQRGRLGRDQVPHAIYDEQAGGWVSDAEIAEVPYTAFASNRAHRTDGRLIMRRVKRLNPKAVAQGQGELFATYRYHAVFTDSPFQLVQAESQHRGHAVIEQVFADLIDGPLAHFPSAQFNANAAWPQLATTAHTMTRALRTLASTRHAVARGATIRNESIQVAGRPTRSGRDQISRHLPQAWPWQHAWHGAFDATHRAPPALAA
jgi:hypothetical protein